MLKNSSVLLLFVLFLMEIPNKIENSTIIGGKCV
jgi:hypothetical protein